MSDSQPILGAKERKYKDEAGNTYCSKGKDLNLIKLKQGNYFIGALEASKAFTNGKVAMDVTYIPEQAAYKFTVKSRAVNYIGDPGFETKESGGNRNIHVSIARYDMKDNELIVRQKLNKNMPDLMKYPFVKSIAKK